MSVIVISSDAFDSRPPPSITISTRSGYTPVISRSSEVAVVTVPVELSIEKASDPGPIRLYVSSAAVPLSGSLAEIVGVYIQNNQEI